MTRILIAGATGHLGRNVVAQLKARGMWVRALTRNPAAAVLSEKVGVAGTGEAADDVFLGDATKAESLRGACDGIEVVVSCLGASVAPMPGKEKRSFRDVDYAGNRNLLDAAKAADVRRFVYVSVFSSTPELSKTAYVKAHEDFADELRRSGLDYTILRPTGFFSAFAEFLNLARRGPMPFVGSGDVKTNPIHDADLAEVIADNALSGEREIALGGPDILTRRQIADMAFAALAKTPRYRRLPAGVLRLARPVVGLFDRRLRDCLEFYETLSGCDGVAPAMGKRRLEDFFREKAAP